MSIAQNFPEIAPSLDLSFALTKKLDPRVTFSRASSATYYGTETAKAEENLLIRSQEFDNAGWTKTDATVTANTTAAPDGTTTADSIRAGSTASTEKRVQQSSTGTATDYVFSVSVKAGNLGFVALTIFDASTKGVRRFFNLTTGAFGTASDFNSPINPTASFVDQGGGWYRITVGLTASSSGAITARITPTDTDGNLSYAAGSTATNEIHIWGAQLEQRSAVTAYTPTTDQPITRYQPVLETVASNVARFDHDPITGESLGLLVEEQRTNLLLRSEEFDNAGVWSQFGIIFSANSIVAPSGELTGDLFVETATTGEHRLSQTVTATLNAQNTASVYIKKSLTGGNRGLRILIGNNGNLSNLITCIFSESGGTFTAGSVVLAGTSSGASASVEDVGNGFYRVSLSGIVDSSAGSGTMLFRLNLVNSGVANYTGDGYSGLFVFGAQLEAGAFPTSYIKTEASQVTRSADSASMTGANFSSWYRQDEGSFNSEFSLPSAQLSQPLITVNNGTNSNRIIISNTSSLNGVSFRVVNGGVEQTNFSKFNPFLNNQFIKASASYQFNNFALVMEGQAPETDTFGTVPEVNTINIGGFLGGSSNMHIRKLSFYPKRLENTQLQALTG